MNKALAFSFGIAIFGIAAASPLAALAALSLAAGNNATTTPNVATSITGFQIIGPAASTTPVQLRATSGSLNLSSIGGVSMSGNGSGTVTLSGTVTNLNSALSTLTYTRGSTGTDTLEVALVNAGEIFFTENDHLYKFVSGSFNWGAAKTAAEAQTAYGASGYLVTITSGTENDFVSDRLTGDGWIGATDSEVESTWKWATGPEAGTAFWQGTAGGSAVSGRYEAWAGGEPNQAGEEDCAETYVSSGTWNDFPCSASLGYVVEFGAPGNMPTVVAQNISIVTADVPAVTSLSPANGAASISPTANLVIGFSKAVTKETGNILIRKVSDDSVVETIDASGGLVSGSGTNTITVNPAASLPEGTQLYVTVPGTAFKDSSNNFFDGITQGTTWRFTTSDVTAPVITGLTATTTASASEVSWTTNEMASTKLWYSADSSYASSTSETDTSVRVTSHEVDLAGLAGCTLYAYVAVSRDATGNTATSSSATFTTLGCSGNAIPVSATSTSVAVGSQATTDLTQSGRSFTVDTPANFSTTSSSVVIQIKSMDADTVLGALGTPTLDLLSAAAIVFNVTALIDNTTELDSFDLPVTVSYQYLDADVSGLDENTLSMYHYKNGTWSQLDSCSVDTATNTITCTAPHFSVFAIFGTVSSSGDDAGTTRKGGTSIRAQVQNLTDLGKVEAADALKTEWHWLFPETAKAATATSTAAVRDLELGMSGEDVRMLQRTLNTNGFVLGTEGAGSVGYETDYFGTRTKVAVAAYQNAKGVMPVVGYWGPLTRASMKTNALSGLWW